MHPVTQMLRAFTWPDQYERKPRKDGRSREKGKSPFEQQLDDLNAVQEALGPEAWPWFGPTIVLTLRPILVSANHCDTELHRYEAGTTAISLSLPRNIKVKFPVQSWMK